MHYRGLTRYWAFFAVFVLLSGLPVLGQTTGRISGFVKDPAGAAIPSVTVTARMTEQQSTSKTVTNSEGFYDFVALPPGDYELVFEATASGGRCAPASSSPSIRTCAWTPGSRSARSKRR